MKTANLNLRPGILLSLLAGLTVAIGLPVSGSAQESTRTIATGSKIPLTADAPDTYTVKPGDTLWDISKLYLRDPWYWLITAIALGFCIWAFRLVQTLRRQ